VYRETIHFQKVVYPATKKGTCPVCGKAATRKSGEKFMQTINPFNTNAEGQVKSRREIMDELKVKADAWRNEPVYHAKCEP
jgi:hypothetical protein